MDVVAFQMYPFFYLSFREMADSKDTNTAAVKQGIVALCPQPQARGLPIRPPSPFVFPELHSEQKHQCKKALQELQKQSHAHEVQA